jgi:ABC-2 type transport system permease protein
MTHPHLIRLRAFLIRDFHNETSYRFSFLLSTGSIILNALIFYFLSEFIGVIADPLLQTYQGDYFSYVIIGIALGNYFSVGLTGFANALRQAQITGTLEVTMMTPTPVSLVIIGSALWSYTYATFRVFVYLLFGALFLTLDLSQANLPATLLILLLSILAFGSIGILAASVIMVIKRGDPITGLFATSSNLLSGIYFPIVILPPFLQTIAYFLPMTYAVHALRLAMLNGATISDLSQSIIILLLFCLLLFPLSLITFRYAVNKARAEGTLAHY